MEFKYTCWACGRRSIRNDHQCRACGAFGSIMRLPRNGDVYEDSDNEQLEIVDVLGRLVTVINNSGRMSSRHLSQIKDYTLIRRYDGSI